MNFAFGPLLPASPSSAAVYTLTADVGSFALGGQAAGLPRALRLDVGVGSLALSGQPAGLPRALMLTAANGAFALGGQSAEIVLGNQLVAGEGAFALSGQAAAIRRALRLTASVGVLTLAGQTAAFELDQVILPPVTIGQAVQRALYDALVAAFPDVPVYDHVRYDAAMPFLVLVDQGLTDDDTIAQFGFRHAISVRFYSSYRGQKEVLEMLGVAWDALHGARLTLAIGRAVVCRCVAQQTMLDGDGLTRRGDLDITLRTMAL